MLQVERLPKESSSDQEDVGTDVDIPSNESENPEEEYSEDDYGLVDDEEKNFDDIPENERQ